MRDYLEIYCRFINLRFCTGFNANRFVADFENGIEDFILVGTTFSDEFLVATFLQKLPSINKPGTLYASFYNNITSTAEMKTFQEVNSVFLKLDHENCNNKLGEAKIQ